MQQLDTLDPSLSCHLCRSVPTEICVTTNCCKLIVCEYCFSQALPSHFCSICMSTFSELFQRQRQLDLPLSDMFRTTSDESVKVPVQDHARQSGVVNGPTGSSPEETHRPAGASSWYDPCHSCHRCLGACICPPAAPVQDRTRPGGSDGPTFSSRAAFHLAYPIGSRRYSAYCRDNNIMHYIGDGDEWHEWQPSSGKGKSKSASSSQTPRQ